MLNVFCKVSMKAEAKGSKVCVCGGGGDQLKRKFEISFLVLSLKPS